MLKVLVSIAILCLLVNVSMAQQVLKIEKVLLKTHPLNNNAPLDFSVIVSGDPYYETLAGETRLGAAQPGLYLRNVTDTVIPSIKIRMRIQNTATGKIVYNTSKAVTVTAMRDSSLTGIHPVDEQDRTIPLLVNQTGILPNSRFKVIFPPFEPAPFIDDQIGRLQLQFIAEMKDSNNVSFPNTPSKADTVTKLYYHMRRLNEFRDNVFEFHTIRSLDSVCIPSVLKWVSRGATIESGFNVQPHVIRHDRRITAANSNSLVVEQPIILLDAENELGVRYVGEHVGDTLSTFPINLAGKKKSLLSFNIKRGRSIQKAHRRWNADTLFGPEGAVANAALPFSDADKLFVEIAVPSIDGLNGIINIMHERWVPLVVVDGAWRTSTLHPDGYIDTIQPHDMVDKLNVADAGRADRPLHFSLEIPDSVIRTMNEGARNVRFRFRAECTDHSNGAVADDNDPFFISNIIVSNPPGDSGVTHVAIQDAEVSSPLSIVPLQMSKKLRGRVLLSNSSAYYARNVPVDAALSVVVNSVVHQIWYNLKADIIPPFSEKWVEFDINISHLVDSDEKVDVLLKAQLEWEHDLYVEDDTLTRSSSMVFGRQLAYDNVEAEGYHAVAVEKPALNSAGFGLRLRTTHGGDFVGSRYGGQFVDGYPAPGWLTMRFTTPVPLGITGYSVGIDKGVADDSLTAFEIVSEEPVDEFGSEHIVPGSSTRVLLGVDDQGYTSDRLANYPLATPITLQPGTYWVRMYQPGLTVLDLCATADRAGALTQALSSSGSDYRSCIADPSWGDGSSDTPAFPFGSYSSSYRHKYFTGSPDAHYYTFGDEQGKTGSGLTYRRGTWVPVLRLNTSDEVVGVDIENKEITQHDVYYSPTSRRVFFTGLREVPSAIRVASLTGATIAIDAPMTSESIDASLWAPGLYLVMLTDTTTTTRQVVLVY